MQLEESFACTNKVLVIYILVQIKIFACFCYIGCLVVASVFEKCAGMCVFELAGPVSYM